MVVQVAQFTPRPPVNLFEATRQSLDTVFRPLIQPPLFATIDSQNVVSALRASTAIITQARLTNTSGAARSVDFQMQSARRIRYRAVVTAQAGQNWVRLDRTTRARGAPVTGLDWTSTPPVTLTSLPDPSDLLGQRLAWAPNSRYLAITSTLRRVRVYDRDASFATLYTSDEAPAPVEPDLLAWSPSGRYLAVTYIQMSDSVPHPYLRVFDFDIPDAPVEVTLPSLTGILTEELRALAWGGPSGRYLIMGRASLSRPIAVLDWNTGSPVYSEALSIALSDQVLGGVSAIEFSPNAARIAIAHSLGARLQVWSWLSATTVQRIENSIFADNTPFGPPRLAWSADSRYLASLSGVQTTSAVTVYDFNSGVSLRDAPSGLPFIPRFTSVAWSADGRYLCLGHDESTRYTYYPTPLRYVHLFDYNSGTPVEVTSIPALQRSGRATDIRWSPDNEVLMIVGFTYDRFYPPTGVDNVRIENALGENFVVNGSFEDMTGAERTAFGYTAIGSVPGWFSDGDPENRMFFPVTRFVDAFATDGQVYLDLVSERGDPSRVNSVQLRQNITGLTPGQSYTLSVDVTASLESLIGLQIIWNGNAIAIDDETRLPITETYPLLSVSLDPGQSAVVPLSRFMMAYGDTFSARASGAGVDLAVSYVLNVGDPASGSVEES